MPGAELLVSESQPVAGAGSAGMGVCDLTRQAMIKHGLTGDQASANFWVLDQGGLLTASREGIKDHVRVFARVQGEEQQRDGEDLLAVVKRVKPTGARSDKKSYKPFADCLRLAVHFHFYVAVGVRSGEA